MVLDYVVQHVDEISLPVLVHYSANYLDWRFKYAQKINDKIHNLFKRKDWMHDVDLNQVTARAQSQVLGSTPAALLTAASDLQALKSDFKFSPEPDQGDLQWVRATPQSPDGQIRAVMVGLRASASGPELAVLDVQDSLGQRSVLTFSAFELNPVLPANTFVFKAPPGADVIRP